MRTRKRASENDSGLEKAERSTSSAQGRRWERPLRRDSLRRETKERKAGLAVGGWDSTDCTEETGITGGTAVDIGVGRRRQLF